MVSLLAFAAFFMKQGIHPTYYPAAKVTCACGNTFTTGSTLEEIHVEICSNCHPFYTGKQKIIDTAGRVDRFKKRLEKTSTTSSGSKRVRRAARTERRKAKGPKASKE